MTMAKVHKNFPDFEYILKVNRFGSHRYQFQHVNLRGKALETKEKMKDMSDELKCNKMITR